jgi:sugar (pentulose or hexulose) kinase
MAAMTGGALWVGVDLGTQSVRVTVVDSSGAQIAAASRPLHGSRDGIHHTQDPQEWLRQTRAAAAEAIGGLPAAMRTSIQAIATCSTSGTIALADGAGLHTEALMYDDARAVGLEAEIQDAAPDLWERLGYRVQPSWALSKLLWLQRAGRLRSDTRVLHQADVIGEDITGTPVAADWSHALKSGYDLLGERWPTEALDTLRIDVSTLPDVVSPGSILGSSSRLWEEYTGLPAGTLVVAGMTDGCAAQLGAGALDVGDWHSVLGTTLVLKGVSAGLVRDDAGAVYSHRAPEHGWLPGGASSVGAGVLGTLFGAVDLDALASRALARWSSPSAFPLAYPLAGQGERFPFVEPDARGFIDLGRTGRRTERPLTDAGDIDEADLLTAVFAGVACTERLCFETLAALDAPLTGRLSTSGGGARSKVWLQLRANTLGQSIAVPASAEGSLGMAILAAWGTRQDRGAADSLGQAARTMSSIARVVDPEPSGAAMMNDVYGTFRARLAQKGWIAQ